MAALALLFIVVWYYRKLNCLEPGYLIRSKHNPFSNP